MKLILSVILLVSSFYSNAHDSKRIDELEKRVRLLEKKARSGGLKVRDMGNKKANHGSHNHMGQGMTSEQKKLLMEKMKEYKKHQEEGQKLLDQMEKEGY